MFKALDPGDFVPNITENFQAEMAVAAGNLRTSHNRSDAKGLEVGKCFDFQSEKGRFHKLGLVNLISIPGKILADILNLFRSKSQVHQVSNHYRLIPLLPFLSIWISMRILESLSQYPCEQSRTIRYIS